jgi:hypothetical protein
MADDVSGGCMCAEIRYEGVLGSTSLVFCHYRDCQYVSGGEPAAIVMMKRADFKIVKGEPATFRSLGDSGGEVSRHFCSNCGTPIFSEIEASPALLFIKAGSLDHAANLTPSLMAYTQSAQPWAHQNSGITSFPKAVL